MEAEIKAAITKALKKLALPEVDFVVEHPAETTHGDYSSNVALVATKQAGRNPRELAEELSQLTDIKNLSYVERVEVAGPGFLNFYLTRDFFTEQIAHIQSDRQQWGTNDSWKDKTVIVEYTDPNPFKELHIGHLVPNALGESLARLFMAAGADTKRVTFQGDVGMHVAKAMYGLQQLGATPHTIDAPLLGKAYATGATAFEENEDAKAAIKTLNKKIYSREDETINALYDAGKSVSLQYFETAYKILGSEFDHNFMESVTGPVGQKLVEAHIGDVFEKSDGAVIFRGEQYGLHTRVFINKEGLPTYETKDVGLIKCKADWHPFDLAITVTGTEQQEYFKVTTKASELIQPDIAGKVELTPNGMLRLVEGKMSSRTGNVVRALDLIADVQAAALARMKESEVTNAEQVAVDVAVAAIKYAILKIAPGKDIVFDLKQSISFEGDSGPYLQYTHARICSVLEKAQAAGVVPTTTHAPAEVYPVEQLVYQLLEVIAEATTERSPHLLVVYLTQLASEFNSFYAAEKIADPADEFAPYKAAVADAVRQTLKNGLWALGIKAPTAM